VQEPDRDDGTGVFTLLHVPEGRHREVAAAVTSALHTALVAYDRLLAGQPLDARLTAWQEGFEELGGRLAAENAALRAEQRPKNLGLSQSDG
jgi:hypothetical protein